MNKKETDRLAKLERELKRAIDVILDHETKNTKCLQHEMRKVGYTKKSLKERDYNIVGAVFTALFAASTISIDFYGALVLLLLMFFFMHRSHQNNSKR